MLPVAHRGQSLSYADTRGAMLRSADVIAFVPSRDLAASRSFYETTLGLTFVGDDGFALVFDANGVTVRVVNVTGVEGWAPAPFTILGWEVPSAERAVISLVAEGVRFERYPGMEQDRNGIWIAPGGARVAWFKDPEGNTLSITEVADDEGA